MAVYKVAGIGEKKKFSDPSSYTDAINYIFFKDQKAAFVGGANISSPENAAKEMQAVAASFNKDKGRRVRHSILSFDKHENISIEQANAFAKDIIQHYAPEYQIAYAVHDNTDEVHLHLVMNQISFVDGHRYRGKKRDYYDFKRHMSKVTQCPILLLKDRKEPTGND